MNLMMNARVALVSYIPEKTKILTHTLINMYIFTYVCPSKGNGEICYTQVTRGDLRLPAKHIAENVEKNLQVYCIRMYKHMYLYDANCLLLKFYKTYNIYKSRQTKIHIKNFVATVQQ